MSEENEDYVNQLIKDLAEAREIIRQIVIVSNLKIPGKDPMLPTSLFVRAENFLLRQKKMAEQKEKKYSGYGYHGGGRKPKGEEPKTTTMSIVCTASERAFIKEQAKNCGLSISGFVLAAINYFYERELKH